MYSTVICGDSLYKLKDLPDESINMCYTCPTPFQYDTYNSNEIFSNEIGKEKHSDNYLLNLLDMFREVFRVLKKDGSLYVMMPSYHYNGELALFPEQFAIMMGNQWYVKSKLIWHRSEYSGQEDTKRFRRDHETLYFFTKDKDDYYFNNKDFTYYKESVLKYPYTQPKRGEFKSGLPYELVKIPILCSSKKGDIVLDPLAGTGTTGFVAKQLKRNSIMMEIDPIQCDLMKKRLDF